MNANYTRKLPEATIEGTNMTKRYLTPLESGELAELAQRLNRMIEDGELVILFQPDAKRTAFEFQAMQSTLTGETGLLAIASVKGGSENVGK